MNDLQPLDLYRQSSQKVEENNLLTSSWLSIAVELNQTETRLFLVPGESNSSQDVTILGTVGDGRFALCFESKGLKNLYPDGIANTSLNELPKPLATALVEVAVRPIIEGLAACFDQRMIVEEFAKTLPQNWHQIDLARSAEESSKPVASLWFNQDAYAVLKSKLESEPRKKHWNAAGEVRVPVRAIVPGHTLQPMELAALTPGGAILLPEGTDPNLVRIHAGVQCHSIATGRMDSGSIVVEQISNDAMNEQSQAINEDLADTTELAEVPVDGIGVRVDFLIGQTRMTFSDLQSLKPGLTIGLEASMAPAVKILVSGQIVGEGELVQIDDRLGVRITRLVENQNG